ncbi:restriction endonuclease subunit S [Candidatus Bathyarchaeota archaeon]|nr:restriction endonuclease subunit S [Candidatus Bathyarchaeota archaeon]
MPRISMEALKNAKIAIPPIDEQIRIAALLDKLQNQTTEIRQRQKETGEKLEKITQTILKKAFMGEL